MGRKFTVSRLEQIAFMASYREILSNLLLCSDHRPEERRHMNTYSSLISLNTFLNSCNILKFVRSRLNHYLIGTMNDDIRKRLVNEYFQSFYDSDQKCDIWAFFDCVLDSNFVELDTHVVFPQSEPNEKFIQAIANHSPNLGVLKLNFEMVMTTTLSKRLKPVMESLSSLVNLTSLSLYYLDKHHRSIIKYLGHSCPRLQHLCISGFPILQKDIIALVLGKNINRLLELKYMILEDEYDIHDYQISTQFLVPLCSTLQHLQLEDLKEKEKLQKSCEFSGLRPSAAAFAIRHMPNLRRIDHSSSSISSAIKLLSLTSQSSEETLESFNEKSGDSSHPTQSPSTYLAAPRISAFSDSLLLTCLDFVNIGSLEMMQAVGKLCPNLKEVTFSDLKHTDNVSHDQLVSILTTKWPKIEKVTFMKVSSNYRQAVLSSIGDQLRHVTFVSCELIDMEELVPCTQLEMLRIFFSSRLLAPLEDPVDKYFDPEVFLPKLTRLESDICLGLVSRVFEGKCSLTHLDLDCCHVSTKANVLNWNDIGKPWRNINILRIRRATNLNMVTAKKLSLQMPKLKELTLPSSMLNSKDEREMSFDLMDDLSQSRPKISLKFERSHSSLECQYQAPVCAYETSGEGSSDSDKSVQNRRLRQLDLNAFDINNDWMDNVDDLIDSGEDDFYDDFGDEDYRDEDFEEENFREENYVDEFLEEDDYGDDVNWC